MKVRATFYISCVLALFSLGCGDMTSGQGQIKELRVQIEQQKEKIEALQKDLDTLKGQQSWSETAQEWGKIAYLTPAAQGYSTIKNEYGLIAVSLEDVRPYANGSRITLDFGNVTSATFNGAQATVEWGAVDAKGSPLNDEAKSKQLIFDKPLRSGAWTKLDVVLEGTPPSSVGFVRIRDMNIKGISLAQYR